jgi:Cu-Zn family superoxide dismutase
MLAARGRFRDGLVAVAVMTLWAWPAAAQRPSHGEHAPPIAKEKRPSQSLALEGLRKLFAEIVEGRRNAGAGRKAEMFEQFLAWPRNPFEVTLPVRFTSPSGVGYIIGTLGVKNTEIVVAGRKEAALFIRPNLRGLLPGLYAFHVHENADCGPAMKDGKSEPGLAAGSHLWLSGTGALAGTTFTSHLGDLPDLEVATDGTATKVIVAARLSLADVAGRSFMIHANQDDNSVRLACAPFD